MVYVTACMSGIGRAKIHSCGCEPSASWRPEIWILCVGALSLEITNPPAVSLGIILHVYYNIGTMLYFH